MPTSVTIMSKQLASAAKTKQDNWVLFYSKISKIFSQIQNKCVM